MEEDFKKQLEIFVPDLLASNNLVVKEIGGEKIKGRDLINYFVAYMNLFKEGKIPEVKSMVQVCKFKFNITDTKRKSMQKMASKHIL